MATQKPVKHRQRRTEAAQDKRTDHTFDLIMKRFDKVDEDNKTINDGLTVHINDDAARHAVMTKTLDQHKTYWGLSWKVASIGLVGWVAWLFK